MGEPESNQSNASSTIASNQTKLKSEDNGSTSSNIFDCCVHLVHCAVHQQVLLTCQAQSRWLPFTSLTPNRSWMESSLTGLCLLLAGCEQNKFEALLQCPPLQSFQCMQVLRLQMPLTRKFITRVACYSKLDPDSKSFKCCASILPHLEWHPLTSILNNSIAAIWGPEVIEFCHLIVSKQEKHEPIKSKIVEFSLEQALFHFVPHDQPHSLEEELLKSLHLTVADIERIFADYMDHCFPSLYQTSHLFKCYIFRYTSEYNDHQLDQLFYAFNTTHSGYLSFHELLLGLACMEPHSVHGEVRSKFIFRYLDTDRSGQLNEQQLKAMVAQMCAPSQANVKWKELMKVTGNKKTITEKDFVAAISSNKFRGTTVLCRWKKSLLAQISRSVTRLSWFTNQKIGIKKTLGNVLIKRNNKDVCSRCKEKRYHVACHLVAINSQTGQLTSHRLKQIKFVQPTENKLTAQQYSIECVFKSTSAANIVIKLVGEFNRHKGTAAQPKGLMADEPKSLWKLLVQLYNDVCLLLNEEFKCQFVYSPCYIVGDIHGNLEDLISMERTLWPQLPCIGANYLFLGDYVDRGHWGLECILYLVAFKILCPNKITLLRGNHEVRSCQTNYTYKKECINKYGELFGIKIWELTNRIFDILPVCAVLDKTIFCAHGGIPRSAQRLEQIIAVPREIFEPEQESAIVWEILWSDPCSTQEFLDTCHVVKVDPDTQDGFVHNTKRGTAFKFNEAAINGFLGINMLTHVIRGHEVPIQGFLFHFGKKCLTIFSSSHYCGNANRCALVLADNQRLRLIQLDTENNASATD